MNKEALTREIVEQEITDICNYYIKDQICGLIGTPLILSPLVGILVLVRRRNPGASIVFPTIILVLILAILCGIFGFYLVRYIRIRKARKNLVIVTDRLKGVENRLFGYRRHGAPRYGVVRPTHLYFETYGSFCEPERYRYYTWSKKYQMGTMDYIAKGGDVYYLVLCDGRIVHLYPANYFEWKEPMEDMSIV